MNRQSFARNSALMLIPAAALLFAAAIPATAAESSSAAPHSTQQSVGARQTAAPNVAAMLADADARNASTDWVAQYQKYLPQGTKLQEIHLLQAASRSAGPSTNPESFTTWQIVYSVKYIGPDGRPIMHSVAYNYNDGTLSFIDYIPSLFAGNLSEAAPQMTFADAYSLMQKYMQDHGTKGVAIQEASYARPNGPSPNAIGFWYFTNSDNHQFAVNPVNGDITPMD